VIDLLNGLDILKWPLVAIVGIFVFRVPVMRLLERATTVKVGQAQIEIGGTPGAQSGIEKKGAEKLLGVFDNALVVESEEKIKQEMEKHGVTTRDERERVLIRYLAAAGIGFRFEQTYRLIYGSQLTALRYLSPTQPPGLPAEQVKIFYDAAAPHNPDIYPGYPFDRWLNFLVEKELISRHNGSVAVTKAGREFLKYIIDQGLPQHKAG
jgi:hypothetical protein